MQAHGIKFLVGWTFPLLACFFIFLIRYPITILGLDVTDEGFSLSNQMLANTMGIQYIKIAPQWLLTDWIGSVWLKMTESWGLWGARLGGLIGSSLVVLFAARIITLIYKPHAALMIALLLAALFSHTGKILYYDNVPVLLFVLFGFFFVKTLLNPSCRVHAILSGIFMALLILSKWPMIVSVFVPLSTFVLCYFLKRIQFSQWLTASLRIYGGAFGLLFLFLVYLWTQGLIVDFLSIAGLAEEHNKLMAHVMRWYWQLRAIIPFVMILFGVPFVYFKISKKDSPQSMCVIFISLFLASIFLSFFKSRWFCPFADIQVIYILMYLMCALISVICVYVLQDSLAPAEIGLLCLSVILPLGQTLGSAAGIAKVFQGMWLLGAVTLMLLMRVSQKERFVDCKSSLRIISILLLALIGWYGIKQTYFYMGRDLSNRSMLSSEIDAPHLKGIYTTPERKESFGALVKEVGKYVKKGDLILAYCHIPMIYFVTSTLPYTGHSWLEGFLSAEKMSQRVAAFSASHPPVLIVRSKTDTMHPEWGSRVLAPFESSKHNQAYYNEMLSIAAVLDRRVQELWNLRLIWSNRDFDLFMPISK